MFLVFQYMCATARTGTKLPIVTLFCTVLLFTKLVCILLQVLQCTLLNCIILFCTVLKLYLPYQTQVQVQCTLLCCIYLSILYYLFNCSGMKLLFSVAGKSPDDLFSSFEETPLGTASLAQAICALINHTNFHSISHSPHFFLSFPIYISI